MRRIVWLAVVAVGVAPFCVGAKEKTRPKILGITQVQIWTTDEEKANHFYYGVMAALMPLEATADATREPCVWCERMPSGGEGPIRFAVSKGDAPKNLISAVGFRTDDAEGLRELLKKNKVRVGPLNKWGNGESFSVLDPENHKLIFLQGSAMRDLGTPDAYSAPTLAWPHIIHAGFVVNDRERMDKFYKDVLGFQVYWTGGMKEGETNWVDMQVPDGTDWIEYMLNVPEEADKHRLGVMNHIAIGVADIHVAEKRLLESRVKLDIKEEPKIGRDGKWQLNLYDPDDTRVELMEFTPVEKPCCSEYMGKHPGP